MQPDNRCWTCNKMKAEAEVRACLRLHCDGLKVLRTADAARQRGETRPPKPHYEPPICDPYAQR